MAENFREYQTIKFFRGSKRKQAEMQRLSDEGLDFEYRRLLIEENELDLHVAFSKEIAWRQIAWSFLSLAFVCLHLSVVSFILIGLAVVSLFFSYMNKRFFQFVMRGYNLSLGIVDSVISDKYGISFK